MLHRTSNGDGGGFNDKRDNRHSRAGRGSALPRLRMHYSSAGKMKRTQRQSIADTFVHKKSVLMAKQRMSRGDVTSRIAGGRDSEMQEMHRFSTFQHINEDHDKLIDLVQIMQAQSEEVQAEMDIEQNKNLLSVKPTRVTKTLGQQMVIYLLFILVYTAYTFFVKGNEQVFMLTSLMGENLLTAEFDLATGGHKDFHGLASVSDTWDFIEGPYLSFLLQEEYDNGASIQESHLYYPHINNFLVGAIRLRKVQSAESSCSVKKEYEDMIQYCYESIETQQNTDTNSAQAAAWSAAFPKSTAPGTGTGTGTDTDIEINPWQWRTEEENGEYSQFAKLHIYPGSGYVADLPLNYTLARQQVRHLREALWLDEGTRGLFMDFQMYNVYLNYHVLGRLMIEFPPVGGAVPVANINALRLERYQGTTGDAERIFENVLMVFIVYLAAESMYGLYTVGICGMLTSFFLMLDLLNTLIFLGILMLRVQFIDGNEDLLERNVRSENIFVSLHTIAFYSVLENILMALNAFILWIKVFKYLNVNKQFYFLSRLFAAAALELVYFTAVFLLIFIAFAHSGYLLFSEDVAEFRSFYNAFVNLFASLTGSMDYEALVASNRYIGPLFYILFQVFVILVMVNVFLAILNSAYLTIREQDRAEKRKKLAHNLILGDDGVQRFRHEMDEEEGEWSKCAKLLCWCLYDEDTVQKMYEMDYTDEEATGAGFTTEQMSGDPRKESDGLSSSAISPGKSLASVEWGRSDTTQSLSRSPTDGNLTFSNKAGSYADEDGKGDDGQSSLKLDRAKVAELIRHNAPPDEGEEDIRRHTEEIFEMFDEHSTGFIVAQDLILHAESKLAERKKKMYSIHRSKTAQKRSSSIEPLAFSGNGGLPTLHEKGTDADTDTHTRRDTQKGKGAKMDPHSENNLSDGEIKYKHKVRKKNLKENKFISKMVEIRRGLKAGTTVDAKDAKTKRNDKDTDNSTKKEKATWSADDADEEADAIAAKERKKMKRDNARVASVLKRVEQLLKIGKPFQRSNFAGDATAAGAGSGGAGGHSSVSSADAGRVGAGGREGVLYGQNPSYPDHVPLRPPALTPLQMQEQARNHSGQSGAVTGDAGMQAVEMGKRFDAMEALLVSMNATMKHMRSEVSLVRKDLDSVQAKQDYHLRMFRRHLFDDASAIASQLAEETVNMHLGGAGGGARTGGRHRHGGHRRHVQHISADTNDYNYSHPHLTGSDNANNVHNNNTTPNNSGYNRDEYDDDRYEYIHRGGTNGANDDDDHITESSGTRRGRDTDRERSRGRERKRNKDANRSKHKSISFRK